MSKPEKGWQETPWQPVTPGCVRSGKPSRLVVLKDYVGEASRVYIDDHEEITIVHSGGEDGPDWLMVIQGKGQLEALIHDLQAFVKGI